MDASTTGRLARSGTIRGARGVELFYRDWAPAAPWTARSTARLLPKARLRVHEGAPHGMFITHMAEVDRELLEFADGIAQNRRTPSREA